jgi:hypothetical protein
MKRHTAIHHSVETIFSVLLFGVFILFLLLMIVFSANVYRTAVAGQEENYNLRTAQTYLITKFRQHDEPGNVCIEEFQGFQALSFQENIKDKDYKTYIYLQDGQLKELFTTPDSNASADMGTVIASLKIFDPEEASQDFYRIYMEDDNGASGTVFLHPGLPVD